MVCPPTMGLHSFHWVLMEGDPAADVDGDPWVVAIQESFESFFRREYRPVLGLAFVLCGDRWVAEELTMEGFEAALRNWSGISALETPGGWVRKVVANASISRFRRLAISEESVKTHLHRARRRLEKELRDHGER